MVCCYAPGCSHNNGGPAGCSFHRFPKNVLKRRLWNRKLRRADRKPTDNSRVCKCHFPRGLGHPPVLLSAAQRSPQPEVAIQSSSVESDHAYVLPNPSMEMPRLRSWRKGFHHGGKKPSSPPTVCPADPETPCTSSSSSPPPGFPPLQSPSELSQPPSPVVLPIDCESPSKKMCTNMYGYIHNVSPIQTSHGNLPYFTATLQQEADYHPVAIYAHHHAKINNIQVNRTPVRLLNPTLIESTTKPAVLSVLVDSNTDVDVIDSLPFPHQPYPVTVDCGLETLGAVQNPWAQYQVQIRVRAFHEEGLQLVKTEDQDIAITPSVGSDTTEGVHITTWEDLKLDLGRWYDLNNVSIHAYDCALTLLTTHSTKAVPAENRAKTPLAPVLDDVMTTYKGEIIGAFATITHTCPQHHTLFKINPELKNNLCAPCEMHYKNTKFCIKCEAIITVELSDSSKKVWKFANGCLAKVVPPQLWTDKEDVIQHLLDLNMVDFKVRNNEIISCSPCPFTRVTTAL